MNYINIRSGLAPLIFPAGNLIPVVNGIRAEVRFGMASRNCSGLGICNVVATSRTKQISEGCATATAFLTYERFGQIRFYFLKATVCLKAEKKHFRRGSFVVRERFFMPEKFTKHNEVIQNSIPAGKYPVTETERFWIVTFNQAARSKKE